MANQKLSSIDFLSAVNESGLLTIDNAWQHSIAADNNQSEQYLRDLLYSADTLPLVLDESELIEYETMLAGSFESIINQQSETIN